MTARPPGPVEEYPWPTQLDAHVVTPGHEPRLHGYSVEADVAKFGGFVETILLSLSGELPSAEQRRVFDIAITFLAPLSVAEAPTHAAVLARICGARSSAVVGITAVALAERAHDLLLQHAALLHWLGTPDAAFPDGCHADSSAERESVQRLRALVPASVQRTPIFVHDPSRTAALLGLLHFSGLRRPEQLEPVLVLASLAPAIAESLAREALSFREYPMQLPPFEYTEKDHG
jgi:hypothetical protein